MVVGAFEWRDDYYDTANMICIHSLRAAVLGKAHALMTDLLND